jgi:hypothetical protein
MKILEEVPRSKKEWFRIYGDPRDEMSDSFSVKWVNENLDWFPAPFPMVLSWDIDRVVDFLYMHKKIGPVVINALEELVNEKGIEYIIDNKHNRWGGCFNYRPQRGDSGEMSTHSFGAAIDLNPALAPRGGESNQPDYVVKAFLKRGFTWGGEFSVVDGMHFQGGFGL